MFRTVLAAMLLFSTSAYAQYQGSAQPNGTGGTNFYGADGRYLGNALPNGTGGTNYYSVPQPNAAPATPPTGFQPLPNGRR